MAGRKPKAPKPPATLDAVMKAHDKALAQALADPDSVPGAHEVQGNPITLAPRIPEVEDLTEKMVTNAVASAQHWKDRVLKPRKDPLAEARKAAPKWKAKMEEAIRNDAFAKGLENVDEEVMFEVIRNTDPSDFARAIEKRRPKIKAKLAKLRPLMLAHCAVIDAMPTVTDADREAKVIANLRGMKKIKAAMRG